MACYGNGLNASSYLLVCGPKLFSLDSSLFSGIEIRRGKEAEVEINTPNARWMAFLVV